MSKVSIITPVTKATNRTQVMQYDPFSVGYGKGDKIHEKGVQPPPTGGYLYLYWMAEHELTYRTCLQILKMYHFREGLEFTNHAKNKEVVEEIRRFFKSVNGNKQTFLDILYELEDDFNIADDAYLCLNRNYVLDKDTGEILYSHINELYRGNPLYYRLVSMDNVRIGGVYGRCLICETRRYESMEMYDRVRREPLRYNVGRTPNVVFQLNPDQFYDTRREEYVCPICNCKLHDVVAVVTKSEDSEDPAFFHIDKEVIHASKYSPSKLYGLSPIITLANHMDARIRLDRYMQSYLEYNRAPQGAIFINTGNAEQVKQTLAQASVTYAKDRYYMPIFAIDSQQNGTIAQYIRFTPLPEELQMLEVESKIRREISALLGVQNVMMNDLEGVGGLNSESLQVQVTDRAALAGQIVYNTKLFPRLMDAFKEYGQFKIKEDVNLIVKRTDNAENEVRMVNFERQINIALSIQDLGYEISPDFTNLLGDDNKKLLPFDFRKLTQEEIAAQQQLGLIEPGINRGDKVTTPSAPSRARIPAFRTKQLMERDGDPIGMIIKKVKNNKGKIVDGMFYKVRFTEYEIGYISKEEYDEIKKNKEEIEHNKKIQKENKIVQKRVDKIMKTASPRLKQILWGAATLKGRYPNDSLFDLIDKAIEVYACT